MRKQKIITSILLFMLLTILAVGCSSTEQDYGEHGNRVKATKALILTIPKGLESLDPVQVKSPWELQVAGFIHEGLVKYDKETGTILPALASHWETSQGGRVYHLTLRDDLYFHSGKELTAQDVKFSWERSLNLGGPEVLQVFGNILGAEEFYEGKAKEVVGIEVLDERNLQITLKAADKSFLLKITDPAAYVLDRQVIEQRGLGTEKDEKLLSALEIMVLAGAGPFSLVEIQPNYMIFEDFPKHYQSNKLERIEVIVEPETDMALAEFLGGQVDILQLEEPLSEFLLSRDSSLSDSLRETPRAEIIYLGFDTEEPPYNDPTLRKLISFAVDRISLAQQLTNFSPAQGLLPRMLLNNKAPLEPYSHDLSETKGLYHLMPEEKETLNLYYVNVDKNQEIAELIKEQLNQVGLKIRLQPLSSFQELYHGLQAGSIDFYLNSWTAGNFDPHGFLSTMFVSSSPGNLTGYDNEMVEEYLNQAQIQELNSKERLAALLEAEKIIMQDSPVITLLERVDYFLVRDTLSPLKQDPLTGLQLENNGVN